MIIKQLNNRKNVIYHHSYLIGNQQGKQDANNRHVQYIYVY